MSALDPVPNRAPIYTLTENGRRTMCQYFYNDYHMVGTTPVPICTSIFAPYDEYIHVHATHFQINLVENDAST